MSEIPPCPTCGSELPPDSPAGLCPVCLLTHGLESPTGEVAVSPIDPLGETTPQSAAFVPPRPEEIAGCFPHLEILELLGQGGMGAVYKARQTKLDRLVALKIIRPESSADPLFTERFTREARTLARLSHPQIVAVHDFGEVEASDDGQTRGLYYFVMEYVDGLNLRQLLGREHLAADETLGIISQVCDALQYAHDEGVVHRDIKPENILIDTRGRVKIADFGLAKIAATSPDDVTLTQTHQVMGTPRYMAPEQMVGSRSVDHRADLYSLGVVFYEMLTGELPLGSFAPPSSKVAIDFDLDEVVLRALASEPDQRFQQADELRACVDVIRAGSESGFDPGPSHRGASTIFEQGVKGLLQGMHPQSIGRVSRHAAMPAVLAVLMCIGGIISAFVPWGSRIVLVSGMMGAEQYAVETIYGFDTIPGVLCGAIFFITLLVHLIAPASSNGVVSQGICAVVSGVFALISLWIFMMFTIKGDYFGAHADTRMGSALACAIGLTLVGAWEIRRGFAGMSGSSNNGLPRSPSSRLASRVAAGSPSDVASSDDPPLTQIRFTVPIVDDFTEQLEFHFLGLGYRLVESRSDEWVFQRGRSLAALMELDIRKYHTTLTVRTLASAAGHLNVSCLWSVNKLLAWISHRAIDTLESEGFDFETMLRRSAGLTESANDS